jgi:hypothetical protein
MRKCVTVVLAASALFLAGCCTTPRATKWEYKVASPHLSAFGGPGGPEGGPGGPEAAREARQAFLNDLGKEGWVLVSETDGRVFYFIRQVR